MQYRLFSLQNGTLMPLFRVPQVSGVKIEEWEANASNGADICSWQNQNSKCESPNDHAHGGSGVDGPGQYTDNMGAGSSAPFTVQQQFLVDRQGLQVFWPYPAPIWYGAWGTPSSSPPGFQPNQTASVTTEWAVITQINVNVNRRFAPPVAIPPQRRRAPQANEKDTAGFVLAMAATLVLAAELLWLGTSLSVYEAARAERMLKELGDVKIGDPESQVLAILQRYGNFQKSPEYLAKFDKADREY